VRPLDGLPRRRDFPHVQHLHVHINDGRTVMPEADLVVTNRFHRTAIWRLPEPMAWRRALPLIRARAAELGTGGVSAPHDMVEVRL
jgi:hypothetical protein